MYGMSGAQEGAAKATAADYECATFYEAGEMSPGEGRKLLTIIIQDF